MTEPSIRRAFADLREGQVHYAECGAAHAPPVLLLHQTPRSWAEYAGVLPRLGRRWRAIAMDTVGFGDSYRPAWPASIERWATVAVELLDALGIARAHVVGHHTGGVIAVELAAQHAGRVDRIVLSSTPYVDAALRRERAQHPPIDEVAPKPDGSHLATLWQRRQAFYPADRPDLLQAFVRDALRVLDRIEDGHRAVASYRMEDRVGRVSQPVLVIRAGADPFAAPHAAQWLARLPQARLVEVPEGMVPLPDQLPEAFAHAVDLFLAGD
jgi:pimeloyl-ACP methyl ester carboxylesterase